MCTSLKFVDLHRLKKILQTCLICIPDGMTVVSLCSKVLVTSSSEVKVSAIILVALETLEARECMLGNVW